MIAWALLGCVKPIATSRDHTPEPGSRRPAEALYREPPLVQLADLEADGQLRLQGRADPGARVRVASPAGDARFTAADDRGRWRIRLPVPSRPQLLGVSMIESGRALQSEGYLLLTPDGTMAQLRAGAGAVVVPILARSSPKGTTVRLAVLALDFDSKGGTVVSGQAAPESLVDVSVDGVRRAKGSAARDGRFSIPLDEPLGAGDHQLRVEERGRTVALAAEIAPATPLVGGPFRATATSPGWRIDWLTPGGGLQTTVLLNQPGATS